MWFDLSLEKKGAHDLPLIILFGVILAFLMAFLFISVYEQQLSAQVDEQASALVNELAQTAFTSFVGGQPTVGLPTDLGGSPYSLSVQDNSVFVVRIVAGRRSGASFSAVVNANVTVENQVFSPGGSVFFMRSSDGVIVSASPIEAIHEIVAQPPSIEPPLFYYFAKDNPKEAAAIVAAYFDSRARYPAENIDILQYRWEDPDSLLAQVRRGSGALETTRVRGGENNYPVGVVVNAWVVELLENAGDIENASSCPSPDNAYLSRWLYSPKDALNRLRSRTWYRASDNMPVTVPADAIVQASAVTTNISVYPAWRVSFEDYTIFFQMMPWGEMENIPGFVFQSNPELNPIV